MVPEIDYQAAHHKVLSNRQVSLGGPMGTERGQRCLVALSHKKLEGATAEVFPGLWHVNDFSAVKPEVGRSFHQTSTRREEHVACVDPPIYRPSCIRPPVTLAPLVRRNRRNMTVGCTLRCARGCVGGFRRVLRLGRRSAGQRGGERRLDGRRRFGCKHAGACQRVGSRWGHDGGDHVGDDEEQAGLPDAEGPSERGFWQRIEHVRRRPRRGEKCEKEDDDDGGE